MDASFTHMGSRVSLIGEEPDQKLIDFYSNEKQVSKNTPPTFLIHSSDDGLVPVKNSIEFYNALQENGIYSEMHIYPYGEHGFALGIDRGGYLQGWTERLYEWIENLDL
jgi:dipeptidyl aminopeptidase/acylaminoacyl peptidase